MTALYIIRLNAIFKVGIHGGTISELKKRYITAIPEFDLISFIRTESKQLAIKTEREIQTKYDKLRVVNANGNKSEWFTFTDAELASAIKIIANNCMEPNTFNITKLQHLYSTGKLISPDYQRPVDIVRALSIKDYIVNMNSVAEFYLPEILLNFNGDTYNIVDGQHRLHALISMNEMEKHAIRNYYPNIIVKNNLTIVEEKRLFFAINKSVPCPGIYLAENIEHKIISECKELLSKAYKKQLSISERCLMPHIHIDTILSHFTNRRHDGSRFLSDWYSDGIFKNAGELITEIDLLNRYIGHIYNSPDGFNAYIINAPYKAKRHNLNKFSSLLHAINLKKEVDGYPCYLGLISLENLTRCMFNHRLFY